MSDAADAGPGRTPERPEAPDAHATPRRSDPLGSLGPTARRAVLEQFFADAHARLRDLLSAAAAEDRETVVRLAAGLAADAEAVGLERPSTAARALARAAENSQDLGAPALALTRALAEASPPDHPSH